MPMDVEPLSDRETEVDRFRILWLATLVENVNVALGFGARNRLKKTDQMEAENWIGSDDFSMVCNFIGIEVTVLLMQIEALREAGLPLEVEVWR